MRPSARLLHRASRITLFTRANCSLCDDAKLVLSRVWNKKPFEFEEIDVMAPAEKQWRDIYEFDTPVVRHPYSQHFSSSNAFDAFRYMCRRHPPPMALPMSQQESAN